MKITCQSCQAKYTIADDKVLGKIVKIRCKKCAATIVVNGADSTGAANYGAPEPTAGSDSAGQEAGQDGTWTVNVSDGDQRNMSDADIVSAFHNGVVGTETYCWKDGMSDWLPLREIDALYDACTATRAVADNTLAAEEAARNQARGGAGSNRPAEGYATAAGNGAANGGASLVAARRAGGRAQGADLFQGAAQAGSEEDVLTSAPADIPEKYDEAQKPIIGARNENSVLFSLSALTSKGGDRPPPTVPGVEASGLIDIRQLSAQMGRQDDKKRSRVDDIMNLSSGGAFNAALAAPVLSPPSIDQYAPSAVGGSGAPGVGGPGKSKALIFLALGAGAFVIVAAVGATTLLMRKGTDADTAAAGSASAAAAGPSSVAMATATGTTTATPATASDTTSAAAPQASAATTDNAAAGNAPAATAATTAAPAAAAPAQTMAAAPVAPHPQAAAAPAPTHAAAAAPPPEADQPFNMGEAKSRLAAAAAAAQACKKPDGPVGTGRVIVVFGPNGGAQSATISGPPFEGTPTGACVGNKFRGVHVPVFSGSPFSVSKSFTIN
jgi:predicted Zn finger-like uncharacterized protein